VDKYWNKERLKAHAAPHLEFNPEKKPWVGLTDDEVGDLSDFAYDNDEEFVRNVEAKLRGKNT